MVSDASKKKALQKKAAAAAKRGGKAAAAATSAKAAAIGTMNGSSSSDNLSNGMGSLTISDRNCTGVLCSHPLSRDIWESTQPATNAYKFAYFEPGSFSYYDYCDAYAISDETYGNNGYSRHLENASTMSSERTPVHMQQDGHSSSNPIADSAVDCPENNHHDPGDY